MIPTLFGDGRPASALIRGALSAHVHPREEREGSHRGSGAEVTMQSAVFTSSRENRPLYFTCWYSVRSKLLIPREKLWRRMLDT